MDEERVQHSTAGAGVSAQLPVIPFPEDAYLLGDLVTRAERYRDWLSRLVGLIYGHYETARGWVDEKPTDGSQVEVPPARQEALSASGRLITQALSEAERGFVTDLEPYLGWNPDAADSFRNLLRRYFPEDRFRLEAYAADCELWHHIQQKYLLCVRELCRVGRQGLRLRERGAAAASAACDPEASKLHPWQRLEIREEDGIVRLDGMPIAVTPEQATYLKVLKRFEGATLSGSQIVAVEPSLAGCKLGRDVRDELHANLKALTSSRRGAGHCLLRADLPRTPDDD